MPVSAVRLTLDVALSKTPIIDDSPPTPWFRADMMTLYETPVLAGTFELTLVIRTLVVASNRVVNRLFEKAGPSVIAGNR
ncbi:hypothetical protein D3C71_1737570 [compost metagenome]